MRAGTADIREEIQEKNLEPLNAEQHRIEKGVSVVMGEDAAKTKFRSKNENEKVPLLLMP